MGLAGNAGLHNFRGEMAQQVQLASASGAITIKSGVVLLTKAGVAAMTLADPVAGLPEAGGDDGKILEIVAVTANAHTVDNSAGSGFNAAGAGSDVGTFGGAKGDSLRVIAYGGDWFVLNNINVTLG